jgi:N4-gp56 family major capsid protein
MGAGGILTSGLTATMSIYYSKVFLARAKYILKHDVYAQKRGLPANQGRIAYFTRHTPNSVQLTALTEAENPAACVAAAVTVGASLSEYGNYQYISSLYSRTSIDTKLEEQVAIMGQNLGETIDTIIRQALVTGNSNANTMIMIGGVVSIATTNYSAVAATDTISAKGIRTAVRQLKKAKALPIRGVQGNPVFGALIGPEISNDLFADSTWQATQQYVNPDPMKRGILGTFLGVEFVETNNNYITSFPNYVTWFFGDQAYGVVSIDSEDVVNPGNATLIIKESGPQDTSNPLNRFSTIGWQATFTPVVLNSLWFVALYTGASA